MAPAGDLRLGLLSTAAINQVILDAAEASDRVSVVAVASRTAERARAYAAEHGIGRWHGSYEALLADPGVDAVYVSLPNAMHVEWSIRALEAGKHVLCEKPLHADPAEVERLRRRRARRARVDGGLPVPAPSADRGGRTTRRVGSDRPAAADPELPRLHARRSGRHPLPARARRRRLPRCGVLHGQHLAAARGRARGGGRRAGPRGDRRRPRVRRDAPVPRRRARPGRRLVCRAATARARGARLGRLAARPRPVPPQSQRRDRARARRRGRRGRKAASDDPYRLELENLADAAAGRAKPLLGRADAVAQARALAALYRSAREGSAVSLAPAGVPR